MCKKLTHLGMGPMGSARLPLIYHDGLSTQTDLFGYGAAVASLDAIPVQFSRSTEFSPAPPVAMLCEEAWPDFSGAIRHFRDRWLNTALLGLFESSEEASSRLRESVEAGLDDFLCAPFLETELRLRVHRLLPLENQGPGTARLLKEKHNLQSLVGESDIFFQVLRKIPFLAASDATVLITGETGTGKELFARAIHYSSARRAKPFIPVNCGALPDHLFENELFGHTRGAYTDAHTAEQGVVAAAEGGTLFLDEIDTLTLQAQVKLLRFLQDRHFRPLGSAVSLEADTRVIAATNASLPLLVKASRFREDLYHRLNVLALTVPPLREHLDDVPALVFHFLQRYKLQYKRPALRVSPDAVQRLLAYEWPGNIRELEDMVHRAVALSTNPVIEPHHFELPSTPAPEMANPGSFQQARKEAIQHFESRYLNQLLTEFSGNVSRAARAAGKDRRSLQRILHRCGISAQAFRQISQAS
jgi:DNA-binding NtrC family response regulator